jgi:hypothetical protein
MTTTTPPNPVLEPAVDDAPSPRPQVPHSKRHWVLPVAVGAVAFGAGVGLGSKLTWRFSAWWKPS